MRRPIVYAIGLALALPCAGILGFVSQSAAEDQAQPNAAQPAQPNPAPDQAQPQNQAAPNPAPNAAPDQQQNPAPAQPNANPAPANPAPGDQLQNPAPANPAPANPAPANPPEQNQAVPAPNQPVVTQGNAAQTGTMNAAPVYSSPLQQFASQQEDEVGMLSQQIDFFRAAKKPEAVMALYHMIRDHQLVVDAARNVLARRGDDASLSLNPMPMPANADPQTLFQNDIQAHQDAANNLQQLISNASSPEEKNIYQQALSAANKHQQWLQALNQGQSLQIGFFGPTVPLQRIAGYRATENTTTANGYPQPRIQRQAVYRSNGQYNRRAVRRHRGMRRHRSMRRVRQTSY